MNNHAESNSGAIMASRSEGPGESLQVWGSVPKISGGCVWRLHGLASGRKRAALRFTLTSSSVKHSARCLQP